MWLLCASPLPVLLKQVVRDINERQARELTDAADEARRLKEQVGSGAVAATLSHARHQPPWQQAGAIVPALPCPPIDLPQK